MSFNTMLATMQGILNRDDCSAVLAQAFLVQGMQRIQRDCRIPSMERAMLVTPSLVPMTQMPVPPDLLQIQDILVPREFDTEGRMRTLNKLSYRRLMAMSNLDVPKAYARSQTMIYFKGSIPIGTQLQFLYYGNFSPFASPDSDNELSASTPDLAVYAGLAYAGDHFGHPQAATWEARYQAIKNEVINMALDLDNEGGPAAIEPLYHWDD